MISINKTKCKNETVYQPVMVQPTLKMLFFMRRLFKYDSVVVLTPQGLIQATLSVKLLWISLNSVISLENSNFEFTLFTITSFHVLHVTTLLFYFELICSQESSGLDNVNLLKFHFLITIYKTWGPYTADLLTVSFVINLKALML